MPTAKKRREVIRSYDRALAILRDEGGVLRSCTDGKYRLTYRSASGEMQSVTVEYTVAQKLFTCLKKRLVNRFGGGTDYVYAAPEEKAAEAQAAKDAAAKREAEQAAERQSREDARVAQVMEVMHEAGGEVYCDKPKLLAILRDVEANGI